MLAGRPQEAVGNVSPRWMTAAPRKRGTEPGLQADSPPYEVLTCDAAKHAAWRGTLGAPTRQPKALSKASRARPLASGTRCL
jgi:hypothetical protein